MPAIPQQGEQRLWLEHGDGAARVHHVRTIGDVHRATIGDRRCLAIEVRGVYDSPPLGASGPPTPTAPFLVPLVDLIPSEPLSAADWAEYDRLDGLIAGTRGDARLLSRFHGLRLRSLAFDQPRPNGETR